MPVTSWPPYNSSFAADVALGKLPGYSHINKFGETTNADNGVATDVWDRANPTDTQAIWTAPTTARTHQIVSSSTNDTSGGTGARTLRIWGLTSWSADEVNEDITMNGTSNVATANSYVIIHRMSVLTKGSSGPNVGTITATADTDSTVTAQIGAGNGQTLMAIFGVPSTKIALVERLYGNLRNNTSTTASVRLLSNPEPDSELTGFNMQHVFGIEGSGTSALTIPYEPQKRIDGPAIIKVQVVAAANNVEISAGFDALLVDT